MKNVKPGSRWIANALVVLLSASAANAAHAGTRGKGWAKTPAVSLSASPTSVTSGSSTTLSWNSSYATSCTASGGWIGDKALSGKQSSVGLMASTSFTLTCTGTGGSASKTVWVGVTAPTAIVAPAPSLSFSASPLTVASGAYTTLVWSASNASSCSASGGWSGSVGVSGSQKSSPLQSGTLFTLTCTGSGGSVTQAVSVSVTAPVSTTTTSTTSTTSTTTISSSTTSSSSLIVPPPSSDGMTTLRIQPTTISTAVSDVGAFRNTCSYSHMAFNDPIVFPGQAGVSHLHVFFGNTSTNESTSTDSLYAAKSSTCAGGIANLSAYWVPAMIDTTTNRAIVPIENVFYYKGGYNSIPSTQIQGPPRGLRMIAGNKPTNTVDLGPWDPTVHHSFKCFADWLPNGWSGGGQGIPQCPAGSKLGAVLEFPNCWDGVNLDSPDHRSHMAYSGAGVCPSTHPVAIAQITFIINYAVPAGVDTTTWRLASDSYATGPGGYSMHGDVWVAWDPRVEDTWTKYCVQASMDCHGYLLGDGTTLY